MINNKKIFTNITKFINIFSWIIALISMIIIDQARPPFESFLNRIKHMPLRKTWDTDIMQNAFYLLTFLLLLCVFSIIINAVAYKKENYSFKFSPIFLSISSVASIIFYFIYF